METSSVHPSPSGRDCDDNSVIPVSLDAVVDIVNDIVDAGPTVCSRLHAEKNFIEKNHDMAVVMAMAEGAIYKSEPILVKVLEDAIINAKKKRNCSLKQVILRMRSSNNQILNSVGIQSVRIGLTPSVESG